MDVVVWETRRAVPQAKLAEDAEIRKVDALALDWRPLVPPSHRRDVEGFVGHAGVPRGGVAAALVATMLAEIKNDPAIARV